MLSHWTYFWGRYSLSVSVCLLCLCLWDIPLQVFSICWLINKPRDWLWLCIKKQTEFLPGAHTRLRTTAKTSLLGTLSDRPTQRLNKMFNAIQLHTVKPQKKQTPPTEQLHRDFTMHAIPHYKESNKLNVIIGVNGLRSEMLWCWLLLRCLPAWVEPPARRRAASGRVGVRPRGPHLSL